MCIYIYFEAVIVIMCDYFPKLLKTHFLLCKYFAVISVYIIYMPKNYFY